MKKLLSLVLCTLLILGSVSVSVASAATQQSLKQAIENYEKSSGETVNTKRYYFLMPNGENGMRGTHEEYMYGEFAPSWYNDNANHAGIYWWDTGKVDPKSFPGYKMLKGDSESVYYADVPDFVETIIFNNFFDGGYDFGNSIWYNAFQSNMIDTCGYKENESDIYPDGLSSFENMIYVINPSLYDYTQLEPSRTYAGEWFYYYGNGCYGTVENGNETNCINEQHDHENLYINFDPTNTGWGDFEKLYCVIRSTTFSPFYDAKTIPTLCTDYDGDGIYTYDLNKSEIKLNDYSVYHIEFVTDTNKRTDELVFQTINIKDTIYATGEIHEHYKTSYIKWTNDVELAIPSLKDVVNNYESENKVELKTYRNYYLIPDGSDKFIDSYGEILPDWFNEYSSQMCISCNSYNCEDFPCPSFPRYIGYSIEKDNRNIYYADIPVNIKQYYIHNGVTYSHAPLYTRCESYTLTNSEQHNNMIYVFNDMDRMSCITTAVCGGEWYFYYGDGCYGTVKDGDKNNCIRNDHFDENGKHQALEYILGDADADGVLSVLDATEIQMVLALLKDWKNESLALAADFDRDGQASVMDATAIQFKLAELE